MSFESPNFELIETLLWTPTDGFWLLGRHFQRLASTAAVFSFTCDLAAVKAALDDTVAGAESRMRVRMTLARDGTIQIAQTPLSELPTGTVWRVALARTRLDSEAPMLRYKTTDRVLYDQDRARYCHPQFGVDELVYLNQHGAVCEGTITTVFVQPDPNGPLITPPLSSGVLPGVLRAELMDTGRAIEGSIRVDQLEKHSFYMGNSVRGLIPSRLVSLKNE